LFIIFELLSNLDDFVKSSEINSKTNIMVDAQLYLDQNYPKETRRGIAELDLSNKNLTGDLNLELPASGFGDLRKLNTSFNKLNGVQVRSLPWLMEFDNSHNLLGGAWDFKRYPLSGNYTVIRKLNFSHNNIHDFSLNAPSLTHLDISNNVLNTIDLQTGEKLEVLNCSGNPITRLTWNSTYSPNLVYFDCVGGSKLVRENTDPTIANLPTPTGKVVSPDNGLSKGAISGIIVGVFSFILVVIGVWIVRREYGRKEISNPQTNQNNRTQQATTNLNELRSEEMTQFPSVSSRLEVEAREIFELTRSETIQELAGSSLNQGSPYQAQIQQPFK